MLAAKFLAQIDDADFGERAIFDARGELEQMIFSGARVVIGLERRSGRAKQRDRAFKPRAIDGGVAAVVARRFFLLVARLLLFVHDDEAEIFERRENGGARAHNDARFAAAHAPPFAGAFDIRQAAVQHGDACAESRANQAADPQSERNFRHEDDGRLAARERRFDRAEIDFRFAAAGDAVKKPGGKFAATSQRQISSSASFCSAFRTFAGGAKSVSHGSSSGVSGSSQESSRPFFSSRSITARETPAFAAESERERPAHCREHFADSFLRVTFRPTRLRGRSVCAGASISPDSRQ